MTLTVFEGPAGSGKTTRLFSGLEEYIAANPLGVGQRVLALTKMHGSRRRMLGALGGVPSDCTTLNSFALGLARRWRSMVRLICCGMPADDNFDGLAAAAAKLLELDAVVCWVSASYPILVVDELQDLRGSDLAVVKGLSRGMRVLCAADDFQDLSTEPVCEAVEWAKGAGTVIPLGTIHRTKMQGLLDAATSLRSGTSPANGTGFKLLSARQAAPAAGLLARNLKWSKSGQVAVISPTGPDSSPFVRDALARLAKGPFTDKKGREEYGPYDVPWESTQASQLAAMELLLGLNGTRREITAEEVLSHASSLPGPLIEWVQARFRLSGQRSFTEEQMRNELARSQALLRAHTQPRWHRRFGLTVHQAKNREFEEVIVLWPLKVGGGPEVHRRLLYNAITRSKQKCTVIVQDPDGKRLGKAPFA